MNGNFNSQNSPVGNSGGMSYNQQPPYGVQPNYGQPSYQAMPPMMSLANAQGNQNRMVIPISGRFVNSEEEIFPNEIEMNGKISLFPTTDYSKIYAKQWNSRGGIDTEVYTLVRKDQPSDDSDILQKLMDKIDSLEQSIKSLTENNRSYNKNYKPQTPKTTKEE